MAYSRISRNVEKEWKRVNSTGVEKDSCGSSLELFLLEVIIRIHWFSRLRFSTCFNCLTTCDTATFWQRHLTALQPLDSKSDVIPCPLNSFEIKKGFTFQTYPTGMLGLPFFLGGFSTWQLWDSKNSWLVFLSLAIHACQAKNQSLGPWRCPNLVEAWRVSRWRTSWHSSEKIHLTSHLNCIFLWFFSHFAMLQPQKVPGSFKATLFLKPIWRWKAHSSKPVVSDSGVFWRQHERMQRESSGVLIPQPKKKRVVAVQTLRCCWWVVVVVVVHVRSLDVMDASWGGTSSAEASFWEWLNAASSFSGVLWSVFSLREPRDPGFFFFGAAYLWCLNQKQPHMKGPDW